MKNKKIAILLVITLVLMQIMPTYAATATGSNADAATPSNADEVILESDEFSEKLETLKSYSSVPVANASNAGVMLLGDNSGESVYSMFNSIASTIDDWSDVYLYVNYTDEYGTHGKSTPLSADGVARMDWTDLTSFGETFTLNYLAIQISKDALPPAGTYTCDFGIVKWGSYNNFEYRDSRVYSRKLISNANYAESIDSISSYYDGYRVVLVPFNLDVGNTSYIEWRIYPEAGAALPVRLNVRLEFTKTSDAADIVAAGGSYTSEDAATDTAVNTAQIAQNTADVNDTLKEIITHISDQLAALWDQLYNYMHLPHLANDDKNTQSIIDTLTNGLSVEVENNDDNTEEIIHGYDQSGIDDANDSLNSSITEYSEAEKDVLDSVNENLNDFEFEESFDAYVSTIGTVSDFLQRMYESSGALKDVINIGFFLSIAGIVVGLYRFKEG